MNKKPTNIQTRFGSVIREFLAFEEDTGAVTFIRNTDGAQRSCHISDLRAPNGAAEIVAALPQAAPRFA
jgi:hypothetical protein